MAYVVVTVLPDGTAGITATNPDDLETALAYKNEHGGEVVSVATVNAIHNGALPAVPDNGIPIVDFKRRLAKMLYILGTKTAETQTKWDRVLRLLDSFTVVYAQQPPVSDLIQLAVADGLLTAEEAVVLAATT
jgi:hypothetical protein